MNIKFELNWDLDGVCANFDQHFKHQFGKLPHEVSDVELWKQIETDQQFYLNIPPIYNMIQLVHEYQQFVKSRIITGRPRRDTMPTAEHDKREWCKRHIGDISVVVCLARDKQNYINVDKSSILVDDRIDNINRWNAAGGVGILHTNYKSTKQHLIKLFSLP